MTKSNASAPHPANPRRIFAIGDVHGCATELAELIKGLGLKKTDLVVFLGDYVDRGPDSRRVIDLLLGLSRTCEVVALKGNHESLFLDFLEHPDSPGAGLFVLNGGTATLANYTTQDGAIEIPDTHLHFLKTLKLWHETENYFFVHAGVPDIPLSELSEEHELALLWSRFPFLASQYDWGKPVVHGHTPVPEVDLHPNRINLDTGCVYDGKLTAMEFPSMTVHQVVKGTTSEPATYPREMDQSRISRRFSGRLPVEAAKRGSMPKQFETLNYNQHGILMREVTPDLNEFLLVGDKIDGFIGDNPSTALEFEGTIARIEARGAMVVYGVKIERISSQGGWAPKRKGGQ